MLEYEKHVIIIQIKMWPRVSPLGVLLRSILTDKEEKMKKIIVLILIVVFLMLSFGSMVIAQNALGPAPNSGDGVDDGSGF